MTIYLKNKHTLEIDDFKFKCCIGKKGLSIQKKEGDKKKGKSKGLRNYVIIAQNLEN